MRHTIKAVGWAIAILWIAVLILPVTVALSLLEIVEAKSIGIQEPMGFFSYGKFLLSIPYYINNTGFYDLTDVSLSLDIQRENEIISTSSAEMLSVPAGVKVTSHCNFSIGMEELLSRHKELLTMDTILNVSLHLHFKVAYAMAFTVSTSTIMPWGAPFHELTIVNVTYDSASRVLSASLSFNNHAFFHVNGTFTMKLYNSALETVGLAVLNLDAPPQRSFQTSFRIIIDDTSKLTQKVFIRLYYFNTQISEAEWLL